MASRKAIISHLGNNNEGPDESSAFANRKGRHGLKVLKQGGFRACPGFEEVGGGESQRHHEKEVMEGGGGEGQLHVPSRTRVRLGWPAGSSSGEFSIRISLTRHCSVVVFCCLESAACLQIQMCNLLQPCPVGVELPLPLQIRMLTSPHLRWGAVFRPLAKGNGVYHQSGAWAAKKNGLLLGRRTKAWTSECKHFEFT